MEDRFYAHKHVDQSLLLGGFLTGFPGEPPAESSHMEELRRFPLLFQNMMHSAF